MKTASQLENYFSDLGALFLTPMSSLVKRSSALRAVVFDWDGVFNAGVKGAGVSSTFDEPDSMGTNLLRYALWREHKTLPITAVITGLNNPSAHEFVTREHFHALYSGVKHKSDAIGALCARYGLASHEVGCVFDDVNDLAMAAECGLRFLVRRDASPLLQDYVARNELCDYITAMPSGQYPVREVAELIVGLLGSFDAIAESRMAWDTDYASYFSARQAVETEFPTVDTV